MTIGLVVAIYRKPADLGKVYTLVHGEVDEGHFAVRAEDLLRDITRATEADKIPKPD